VGARGIGAWRLFDSLRRTDQDWHHHDTETDDNGDGYHCDFHCKVLPLRTDTTAMRHRGKGRCESAGCKRVRKCEKASSRISDKT
jgi:hypothetical protein